MIADLSLDEPSLEAVIFIDDRMRILMNPLKLRKSDDLFVDRSS